MLVQCSFNCETFGLVKMWLWLLAFWAGWNTYIYLTPERVPYCFAYLHFSFLLDIHWLTNQLLFANRAIRVLRSLQSKFSKRRTSTMDLTSYWLIWEHPPWFMCPIDPNQIFFLLPLEFTCSPILPSTLLGQRHKRFCFLFCHIAQILYNAMEHWEVHHCQIIIGSCIYQCK